MATDELASLRDIHLPTPVHHWPIAIGWWILYGLLLFCIIWGIYKLWRNYVNERPKREALRLLNQIKQSYLDTAASFQITTSRDLFAGSSDVARFLNPADKSQDVIKRHSICNTCNEVNHLLKRVTLAYYPRIEVAELHGTAWLNFLSQTSRGLDFHRYQDYLLRYPYQKTIAQPQTEVDDVKAFFETVHAWIQQQKVKR